ncbi:hypothetical protein [Flavobacterium sp.]|uniref:hypothetical protein n=1 Tax=Flavobacterium sp. TaxID=239 RepID=UPI00391A07D0
MHRFGQSKNSGCCGAARAALGKLQNNQIQEGNITEMDYQMNTLEQIVLKEKNRITSATVPLYETTEVIYEAIDKRINELVEATTYNCKYVILVGAILINSDTDIGSFSATKRFDVIELATGKRIDYLNKYLL